MKITLKADFQKDDRMSMFLYLPSTKPIKIREKKRENLTKSNNVIVTTQTHTDKWFQEKVKIHTWYRKITKDQYPIPLKFVRIHILKTMAGRRAGRERSLGPSS